MPYSDPTGPSHHDYLLRFHDAVSTETGEYLTYFRVTLAEGASPPEADTRAAFQRLVDLIDSSPDFTGVVATRTGPVTQTVTPTTAEPEPEPA